VNLYRSSGGQDLTHFVVPAADTSIGSRTGGTSAELAAGFTLALSASTSAYGELGRLWALGGAARVGSTMQGSLGLKVRW